MSFAAAIGASFVAGLAVAAWTALTLAEFGHFVAIVPILVFPAAAVLTFRLLWRGRTAGEPAAVAPEHLLAACIGCASLLLSIPTDEILLGGQDPGVYVHIAASVARTGSLLIEAPDIAALSAEERGLLTYHYDASEPFLGMRVLPDGRLSPQFYHLFPSLMAVAWSIGGVRAALLVNPLLNVAAIVALYALASLLVGRRWALAAALVHALASAQLRQAKFPTAELTAQFFLLSGIALLALATRDDTSPPWVAPLAGAALGMATLTRSDTIIFLIPLFAVLLVGMEPAGRTRPVLAALGTTSVFFIQSRLHQRFISPYYEPLPGLFSAVLPAAVLLVAAFILVRRTGMFQRVADGMVRWETGLRAVVAGLVCGWVLFGWVLRPRLAGSGRVGQLFRLIAGDPPTAGVAALLSGPESRNMLYLVDLLGAFGLLAATAGIAFLLLTRRRLWETAWLGASVALLVAVTVNVHHDHTLMWVSRRFIPVVMPLASVGIAAAGAALASLRRRRSASTWAGIILVAVVLWLNAGATRAMANGREWPGLIGWYEQFEKALPADADLYCDQPGFAAPVRFISGRRAYELQERSSERIASLIALMRRKAAEGRPVVYLSEQRLADPQASGLVPLGFFPLRSSILVQSKRGVPTQTKPRGADFVLYRVLAGS